jgi:acid phosphatase class B
MPKNLNSLKINLVNKVKQNQSFFYNNSSMNSFINKIVKTNRFNKIDEYREMLEYIIDNEIEYKTKIFDELQSDIKLPKLLENRTEEIITISYSKLTDDGEDKIENEISRQIINMHNKHPNNLIKVTSSYPNKYKFDMKIEPSEFTNYTMKFIKYLVFFLLHEDSNHYYPSMYYAKEQNRLTDVEIKITSYPKINGYSLSDHYRTIQKFEDSKSTLLCVPTAIKNYFINKQSETTNERTFNKYKTMINTITHPKYNKPYTVDELKTLSDELKISFTITDFVNEPIYIGKNSSNSHNIKLINTRMNHLENYCNQEVKIDSNRVDDILQQLPNYVKDGSKIYTQNKTYIINKSESSKVYQEHIEKFNLDRNYLMSDSSESEYISNYYMSVHQFINDKLFENYKTEISKVIDEYNNESHKSIDIISDLDYGIDVSTTTSVSDSLLTRIHQKENEMFREVDLINAYYTLNNKSEYGVPSNAFIYYDNGYATDIENHIINKLVGYYTIDIYDIDVYEIQKKIDKIFGNNRKNIVLTTPQVMTLKKIIPNDFRITSCIIAPSIAFKFDEKSLEKEKNLRHYCKIAGTMMKGSCHYKKYIKTDKPDEFVKLIDNKKKNVNISINEDNIIEIDEDTNKTLKHIGFFIHSFVSAEVMNFILNNDESKILGVKLDSIIVEKQSEMTYDKSLYKLKEANVYNLVKLDDGFLCSFIDTSRKYINNCEPYIFSSDEQMYKQVVSLQGKGGSGKSTDIQKNFNPKKNVYSALAWSRCVDFSKEYKCQISSLDKLLGNKCDKLTINPFCQMIVLDESTMISSTTVSRIINEFPDKRIVIIGDIDDDGFNYQCSLSDSLVKGFKLFNPKDFNCQSITYILNYRFDEELNNKLDKFSIGNTCC